MFRPWFSVPKCFLGLTDVGYHGITTSMPIVCPHCSRCFQGEKLNARHLAKCNPSVSPAIVPCLCGHPATSLTQMKRHKRECALWQARDLEASKLESLSRKKATSLARYGVEDASQAPEVIARREATNVARYGAANPFSKGASTFQKVQDSLVGKRPVLKGADNPFAKPEVQEKARRSMVVKYGAANAQQVPEIRERTKGTNKERYGGELRGSSVIRAQIDATNLAKYGTTEPSRTPEVVGRIRQTNLTRYGVEWTNQDPDVRRRQLETMFARYGNQHYFASEEGKREVRAALMERYGVEFPGAIDGHWGKAVAAFRERYRVDHPLQLEEFRAKQRATNIERYGQPFPGVPGKGPNKLEARVAAFAPSLIYTGNHTFWKWLPKLGRHKNPDFLVPGPDPEHTQRDIIKVVEVFGDFWHSRMFTGKAPFDHEQELIAAYADIGIQCLILWESEVKSDPEGVQARLTEFCSGTGVIPCDLQ